MKRAAENPFVRIIMARPILNVLIILTGFCMLAYTGFIAKSEIFDEIIRKGFLQSLGIGLIMALALPLSFHMLLQQGLVRMVGLAALLISLAIVFLGVPFVSGGLLLQPGISRLDIMLLFVALVSAAFAGNWASNLPWRCLVAAPIIILALVAGIGFLGRIGGGIDQGLYGPMIMAALNGLLITIVMTLHRTDIFYEIDTQKNRYHLAIPVMMFSMVIAAGAFLIPLFFHVEDYEGVSTAQAGMVLVVFALFGVLLMLPPFLLLKVGAARDNHSDDKVLDITLLWKSMRRILSVPSSYGYIFIWLIVGMVTMFTAGLLPPLPQFMLMVWGVVVAGLCFLSLRAVVLLAIIWGLGGLFVESISGIYFPQALSITKVMASVLAILVVIFPVKLFCDISAKQKYSRDVVEMVVLRTVPHCLFFLSVGCLVFLFVGFSGVYPQIEIMSWLFLLQSGVNLMILPAAMIIVASRYGKF